MQMFILKIRNQEEMSIFKYGFIQLLEVVVACSPLPSSCLPTQTVASPQVHVRIALGCLVVLLCDSLWQCGGLGFTATQ